MYVIETDAFCKHCLDSHGYVTRGCGLMVYVDLSTARWVANAIEGSAVREIDEVPEGISYTLSTHIGGRPDPTLPLTEHSLPRR